MTQENDPRSHHEVAELLPWYVNKTLPTERSSQVDAHIAVCADCQREIAALKALEAAVADVNEQLPRPSTNLMARVMDRVDAYENQRTRSKDKPSWRSWAWIARPGFVLAEVVAIALVVAATAVFITRASRFESLAAQERARADAAAAQLLEQEQRYKTLAENRTDHQKDLARINVIFRPEARGKEISELLLSIKASIAQGPSPLGLYVVVVPVPEGSDRQRAQDEAVKKLRSNQRIVAFAESKLD